MSTFDKALTIIGIVAFIATILLVIIAYIDMYRYDRDSNAPSVIDDFYRLIGKE